MLQLACVKSVSALTSATRRESIPGGLRWHPCQQQLPYVDGLSLNMHIQSK